jgi:hypothetical protein
MTTNTSELSLVLGSCYTLAVGTEGAIWSYDGDNGRGWFLFSLVDGLGEDEKSSRRVRRASILAEAICPDLSRLVTSIVDEIDGALVDALVDSMAEQELDAAGDRYTETLEKASTKAAREEEQDDGDDDRYTTAMSRTIARYVHRYVPGRNASGTATKTCGDELAIAWLQMDVEAFCYYAANLLGMSPGHYLHLNPGQQRMNFGNRLRAAIRKGIITEQDALAGLLNEHDMAAGEEEEEEEEGGFLYQ